MTEQVGLFGWPVEHSVSPPMHNAAFAALGLDWRYDLIPVTPDDFADEVTRRVNAGYRGFNCTIPHKRAAFEHPLVDEVTPAVEAVGVANTLIVKPNGRLRADNTDVRGFGRDLRDHGMRAQGQACLVLGAGGSAQAVVAALHAAGAASVTCFSRQPDGRSGVAPYDDLPELARTAGLIVNCTPVGMFPHTAASPWPLEVAFPTGAALYDLIYNPPVTRLMQQAQRAGLRTANGLGMLVWQGAYAFETWTGVLPPADIMTEAARDALGLTDQADQKKNGTNRE